MSATLRVCPALGAPVSEDGPEVGTRPAATGVAVTYRDAGVVDRLVGR